MITVSPFSPDARVFEAGAFVPVSWCRVCGGALPEVPGAPADAYRCERHEGRNPCCIEGCRRSVAAPVEDGVPHLANDQAICGTHWRLYMPPRSLIRRAYHAHFRRAKRLGWTHRSVAKFERFWDALVRTARRRSEGGHVDEAAINRLFGWDQDGGC
ncbi:MAG: hypothetical protein ACJ8DZ_13980 [Allosphingosinicella sp.]